MTFRVSREFIPYPSTLSYNFVAKILTMDICEYMIMSFQT